MWLFKTGDPSIEVMPRAGLAVFLHKNTCSDPSLKLSQDHSIECHNICS